MIKKNRNVQLYLTQKLCENFVFSVLKNIFKHREHGVFTEWSKKIHSFSEGFLFLFAQFDGALISRVNRF